MSEAITITIPSSIVNQNLPMLIERLCQLTNINVVYKDNDKLKDIVARLYVHCQRETMDNQVNKKLLNCLSNHVYKDFNDFLDWVEHYEAEHYIILEYLSQKVNAGIYASIVEDDDFNKKLVDLLIAHDDDLDDVLRSYHANKNQGSSDSDEKIHLYKGKVSTDFLNQAKANNETMPNLNDIIEDNNMDKAKKLADGMDDEKFESILLSLGLDEVGMNKARKIKADVQSGKQLNMMEIMAFAQEYKSNIDAANLDIGKLMALIFSPTDNTTNTTNTTTPNTGTNSTPPFDINSIMNMMSPLINSFSQPKGKGRGQRSRRR